MHGVRLVIAFLLALAPFTLGAQELRIGVGTEATTMDPHFYNLTPNSEATAYVFDTLVWSDSKGRLIPWLAASWSNPDEQTWEFKLRPGVSFHDGKPFTADDVLATFARVPTVKNSPSNYAKFLSHVVQAEAVDKLTLRLHVGGPYPFMTSDLTQIAIIPRGIEQAGSSDFNSGKVAIGTGPYKLVEWVPGDRLVYARNDAYWGRKPDWARVVVKPLASPAARTAAMLSGGVDLINLVSPDDLAALRGHGGIEIRQVPEERLMYLAIDANRDRSPFVTDRNGAPLDRNPLADLRVRRAISKAIDRTALVERVMSGQAIATGDLLPPGEFGTSPELTPDAFDPEGARRLLGEAGYPNGFGLTVHGPSDRYLNDGKITQVVAQFLSRVGIAAKVETLPKSVYFTRVANREFSLFLIGTSSVLGTGTYSMLTYIFATRDPAKLLGGGNWGHYSNPAVDDLIDRASRTLNDGEREALVRQAGTIVTRDTLGIVPLFFTINSWAMRKGLEYHPRSDSYTLAVDATPAQ